MAAGRRLGRRSKEPGTLPEGMEEAGQSMSVSPSSSRATIELAAGAAPPSSLPRFLLAFRRTMDGHRCTTREEAQLELGAPTGEKKEHVMPRTYHTSLVCLFFQVMNHELGLVIGRMHKTRTFGRVVEEPSLVRQRLLAIGHHGQSYPDVAAYHLYTLSFIC